MIEVGLTELHGIADEYSKSPPDGVHYSIAESNEKWTGKIFKSPAKGVLAYVKSPQHDLIEAPLFPVVTKQPWIYTPADFATASAFELFGIPTPRKIRVLFLKQLFKQKNFKQLIFKSQYGLKTLAEYGGITESELSEKVSVINPVVARIDDSKIQTRKNVTNLLFLGDFFRKGGMNVVDAFIAIAKIYDNITLSIYSPINIQTQNNDLKNIYLRKISEHPRIKHDFINRKQLMEEEFPKSDIYLCPTYQESWGFSIQEAMAFGKPIITTDINAIPEMITHEKNGLMVPIADMPYIKNSKGYIINEIDNNFSEFLTSEIQKYLTLLIENFEYRQRLGKAALETARTRFSVETRNNLILPIYQKSLSL